MGRRGVASESRLPLTIVDLQNRRASPAVTSSFGPPDASADWSHRLVFVPVTQHTEVTTLSEGCQLIYSQSSSSQRLVSYS